MDARLNVHAILGLNEGDAHVIRNAGGVVTDDEIRSLAISQRLLGTREIILIHHTDCGMLTFTDDGFKRDIEAETGIKPPWAAEAFTDPGADVRQSIARIKASPFIPHTDSVRGFVFDVATGKPDEVKWDRRHRSRHKRARHCKVAWTPPPKSVRPPPYIPGPPGRACARSSTPALRCGRAPSCAR